MISGAVGPGEHHEQQSIWVASTLGGAPRKLRDNAFAAKLSPDDSLVAYGKPTVATGMWSLWLADADGENPRELIGVEERGEWIGSPSWSPDARRIVYRRLVQSDSGLQATIESRALDDETPTVLLDEGTVPVGHHGLWTTMFDRAVAADFLMLDDRLIYAANEPAPRSLDRNLWELAIDPGSGQPRGVPRRLTDWVGLGVTDLSATADGSQLAFRDFHAQSDVYFGELGHGGSTLDNVRRLTLDDRDDVPSCWTPDGRAVVFESTRYGNKDLFVQGLDQRDARDLVVGAGEQSDPRPTPDGAFFLYWESQRGDARLWNHPRRLLRIPVAGGPTELVLETGLAAGVWCTAGPDGFCLLSEWDSEQELLSLSRLDPVKGRAEEIWQREWRFPVEWTKVAVSPDGSRGAIATGNRIVMWDTATVQPTPLPVQLDGLSGVDWLTDQTWSADGSGLYVTGGGVRSGALLYVDLQGRAKLLHEVSEGIQLRSPRLSPDGRHLAFEQATKAANVWIVEGFSHDR